MLKRERMNGTLRPMRGAPPPPREIKEFEACTRRKNYLTWKMLIVVKEEKKL